MGRSLRGPAARVGMAVATGGVVMAAGVGLILSGVVSLRDSASTTLRSTSLLVRVIAVERSAVDAETGLRGYVITASRRFLGPLDAAERAMPNEIAALRQEAQTDHVFVARAARLGDAAQGYLAGYVPLVMAQVSADPPVARSLAVTLDGKGLIDGIRRQAATLERLVSARQRRLERAARASADTAETETIVVLVLLVLLTVIVGGLIGRLVLARERAGERAIFLAGASRQLEEAESAPAVLETLRELLTGRLADACAVREVATGAEQTGGERDLAARREDPAASAAFARLRAVGATASEPFTVGEDVHGLVVTGVARGEIVVEIVLLRRARGWSASEVEETAELATRTALAAHLRRLGATTLELYERSDRTARTLQESLLPREIPQLPGCELAVRFTPAGAGELVGGDFYDVFAVAPGRFAIIVADVCGKGAAAAAVTAMARWTLRSVSGPATAPAAALRALNAAMLRQPAAARFVTVAYVLVTLDGDRAHLEVACGGHPPPIVVGRDGGGASAVRASGDLIGVWPAVALHACELALAPGETLIVYTDGVTGEGLDALPLVRPLLADRRTPSALELASALESRALAERAAQRDDIAIVALRFLGRGGEDGSSTPGAAGTSALRG